MVYISGDTTVKFYPTTVSLYEFIRANRHLGLTDKQLREAYKLLKSSSLAGVSEDIKPAP